MDPFTWVSKPRNIHIWKIREDNKWIHPKCLFAAFQTRILGMYRVNDTKDNNQRVIGEIIFPKKECYLDLRTSLDGLEAFYGPNNPNNMYERKEMNAMDEAGNIYGCITYICLLNESDGLIFAEDIFDWKKFMKSKGLRDAAEDWAEK